MTGKIVYYRISSLFYLVLYAGGNAQGVCELRLFMSLKLYMVTGVKHNAA